MLYAILYFYLFLIKIHIFIQHILKINIRTNNPDNELKFIYEIIYYSCVKRITNN